MVIVSALRTPITKVRIDFFAATDFCHQFALCSAEHPFVDGLFMTSCCVQAKRGGLKDTLPDDMLGAVFQATLERTGINPAVRNQCCNLCFSYAGP